MSDRADQRFGTIPRMAAAAAERWGDAPAVVDGATTLTFADLAAEARRVAGALVAAGVCAGDRVALWAPNSAAWIVAALGAQGAGAWLVPLNTRFKGAEAADILSRAGARTLFVAEGFMGVDHVAELRRTAPALRALSHVVPLPRPDVPAATTPAWEAFLASGDEHLDEADARLAAGTADDISDVMFTSGTTGKPKGVLLRHGTSLRCYESYNTAYRLGAGDRHLITTPFFHCFGYKAGWMLSLLAGATTYPVAVFDADRALATIEQHRITHVPGAPTVFSSLLQHPRRTEFDLSSLRVAIVSAASIPPELVTQMAGELGFEAVMSGYGLTENHALGTFTRPDDPLSVVATSVGRPAPDIDVRIVDDAGNTLPAGRAGELLLGGYAHMAGYYRDPEATAEAITGPWLHTGDVAVVDEQGYVHITDRKKDIFIMGGFNVAPAEVESALLRMPGVAQVAVVGMPDDRYGEVGAAFVVPQPDMAVEPDEVIAFARSEMANYKVPRHVEIVDQLPMNATGKVLRHELRGALRRRSGAAAPGRPS